MSEVDPGAEPGTEQRNGTKAQTVAAVAAVAAVLMLVLSLATGGREAGTSDTTAQPEPVPGQRAAPSQDEVADALAALARREPGDPTALGDPAAPVVMIEYSDFQCPYCARHARETAPVLIERFVRDGTLRIEWRHFPYLGPESTVAAHGGGAAAEQGMFWEFHHAIYADPLPPNSGRLDDEYLAAVAEVIGLDVDRFLDDLASERVADAVQRDFAEGQAIGVNGTPAFLVNGRPIIGAQPVEVFIGAIELAAEAAR